MVRQLHQSHCARSCLTRWGARVRRLFLTAMGPGRHTTPHCNKHPATTLLVGVADHCLAVGPGAVGPAITSQAGLAASLNSMC
jgi:hypothetical protein